ncbi:putative nuclease HARBI1 [Rhinatrema bivittatum]|uniref:putative nuclease HARBI1 n=1 Tax=Rhinatrema bivittatum TaxID=194408 RepID=UPI00112A7C12|nr:putative nuclease HARBI1 [Rhinatrema bivittatum]
MRILSVMSSFPGSVHDSFILRQSALFRKFEGGLYGDGWLVGDAAYGCRPWLMTPILQPATARQLAYNAALSATRSVIERTFDLLKSRFRCLEKSGGALLYAPRKVARIILLCCVFHNVALRHGIPVAIDPDLRPDPPCARARRHENTVSGSQVRQHLIQTHF